MTIDEVLAAEYAATRTLRTIVGEELDERVQSHAIFFDPKLMASLSLQSSVPELLDAISALITEVMPIGRGTDDPLTPDLQTMYRLFHAYCSTRSAWYAVERAEGHS